VHQSKACCKSAEYWACKEPAGCTASSRQRCRGVLPRSCSQHLEELSGSLRQALCCLLEHRLACLGCGLNVLLKHTWEKYTQAGRKRDTKHYRPGPPHTTAGTLVKVQWYYGFPLQTDSPPCVGKRLRNTRCTLTGSNQCTHQPHMSLLI
jgi:hypothetical protein